ncbi:MAG: ABC transporter ATP-binding protein [Firmicutes bacterium]|nr:ABC transporter ATP-binding protein [Bacillota bacterium]
MAENILEYNSGTVRASLARGERVLLRGVSFTLAEGESLALIGETGSGKTMTALSIMRLLPRGIRQDGGRALFLGEPLPGPEGMRSILGSGIVYIPQSGAEALAPLRRLRWQLRDGLLKNGVPRERIEEKSLELLSQVGFEDPGRIMDSYPFELSGGMAQRVVMALAACADARLVIADEPTNGLDREATAAWFGLARKLFSRAAMIVITHDISVAGLCGRAAVLCGGTLCESGPAGEIISAPLHPYTRALISALPQNGMAETPRLRSGRSGCPFYGRCPEAGGGCEDEIPELSQDGRSCRCARIQTLSR